MHMGNFSKFIIYNVIVYFLYMAVDTVFTFLHFYSSDKLGQDLVTMPTNTDMMLIFLNIIISTVAGYIVLQKLDGYIKGE